MLAVITSLLEHILFSDCSAVPMLSHTQTHTGIWSEGPGYAVASRATFKRDLQCRTHFRKTVQLSNMQSSQKEGFDICLWNLHVIPRHWGYSRATPQTHLISEPTLLLSGRALPPIPVGFLMAEPFDGLLKKDNGLLTKVLEP